MGWLPTTVDTSVCSDHESRIRGDLSRLATQGNPHPDLLDFFEHKRAIRSSSSSVVEAASSGSGATRVVLKGGCMDYHRAPREVLEPLSEAVCKGDLEPLSERFYTIASYFARCHC